MALFPVHLVKNEKFLPEPWDRCGCVVLFESKFSKLTSLIKGASLKKRTRGDVFDEYFYSIGSRCVHDVFIVGAPTNGALSDLAGDCVVRWKGRFVRNELDSRLSEMTKSAFDQMRKLMSKYCNVFLGSESESLNYKGIHVGLWDCFKFQGLPTERAFASKSIVDKVCVGMDEGQKKLAANLLFLLNDDCEELNYIGSAPGTGWKNLLLYGKNFFKLRKIRLWDPREKVDDPLNTLLSSFYDVEIVAREFDAHDVRELSGYLVVDVRRDVKDRELYLAECKRCEKWTQDILDHIDESNVKIAEIKVRRDWKLSTDKLHNVLPQLYFDDERQERRMCIFVKGTINRCNVDFEVFAKDIDHRLYLMSLKTWFVGDYFETLRDMRDEKVCAIATLTNACNSEDKIVNLLKQNRVYGCVRVGSGQSNFRGVRDFSFSGNAFESKLKEYFFGNFNDVITILGEQWSFECDAFETYWFESFSSWGWFLPLDEVSELNWKYICGTFDYSRYLRFIKSMFATRFTGYQQNLNELRRRYLGERGMVDLKDINSGGSELSPISISGHAYKLFLLQEMVPFSWKAYRRIVYGNLVKNRVVPRNSVDWVVESDCHEYRDTRLWHSKNEWNVGIEFGAYLVSSAHTFRLVDVPYQELGWEIREYHLKHVNH